MPNRQRWPLLLALALNLLPIRSALAVEVRIDAVAPGIYAFIGELRQRTGRADRISISLARHQGLSATIEQICANTY